jgi:hypothetical protein
MRSYMPVPTPRLKLRIEPGGASRRRLSEIADHALSELLSISESTKRFFGSLEWKSPVDGWTDRVSCHRPVKAMNMRREPTYRPCNRIDLRMIGVGSI